MPKANLATPKATPEEMAYASLSTDARPVSADIIRRLPQVTLHLDKLDGIIGNAMTVHVSLPNAAGALTPTPQSIQPYGPGDKLRDCWHRLLTMSDIPDALRLADLYYSQPTMFRDAIPLEVYCYAADVNPLRVVEWLTGILVRQGVTASTLLAATWHPRVMEKTIEVALTDKGRAERLMLHKATGFVPVPKGSQTIVNVQPGAAAAPIVVVAPSPEKTISQLAGAFNEERGLPAPVELPVAMEGVVDAVVEDGDDE